MRIMRAGRSSSAAGTLRANAEPGIDLLGASYSKKLFGVTTGVEVNYRHNTPLTAQTLGQTVAPAPALAPVLFPHGAPQEIRAQKPAGDVELQITPSVRQGQEWSQRKTTRC